jgi:hypothetical protein
VHWPAYRPGNAAEPGNLRRVSRDIAIASVFSCFLAAAFSLAGIEEQLCEHATVCSSKLSGQAPILQRAVRQISPLSGESFRR